MNDWEDDIDNALALGSILIFMMFAMIKLSGSA